MTAAAKISLHGWDVRYRLLKREGWTEPEFGGPLRLHYDDGDLRLAKLKFDNSKAAHNLWNFLLSEEDRLHRAKASGKLVAGTMKDLGTVPVMVFSLSNAVAFYPDGAWWTPSIMENSDGLLQIADEHGIDESFCPVRAMLGAFVNRAHFPVPDPLFCSVGATCDDFSAIAQRIEDFNLKIHWWEIPHWGNSDEEAPEQLVDVVEAELARIKSVLEKTAGESLDDDKLSKGIRAANWIRERLRELRTLVYGSSVSCLPALETMIAEMLALHYCSDRKECLEILDDLIAEVAKRLSGNNFIIDEDAVKVYWINPVADLRMMNLLEDCGCRLAGADFMFPHALDEIPEDLPPLRALAKTALADPMTGTVAGRAKRICREIREFGSEAVVVSRIPGASHCAYESRGFRDIIDRELGLPAVEIEVPPVIDAMQAGIVTRLQALRETVLKRR